VRALLWSKERKKERKKEEVFFLFFNIFQLVGSSAMFDVKCEIKSSFLSELQNAGTGPVGVVGGVSPSQPY
jgi:hypothetical protein